MSNRPMDDNEMSAEVDFSKGVCGLHHIPPGAMVYGAVETTRFVMMPVHRQVRFYPWEMSFNPGTPKLSPRLCVTSGTSCRSAVAAIQASAHSIRHPRAWAATVTSAHMVHSLRL
ncbi:MAG: hypothetical protein ABI693_10285 [Bryobacteraceae bacterium]